MKLDKQTLAIIIAAAGIGAGGAEMRTAVAKLASDVTDVRERVARIEATLELGARRAHNESSDE